MSESGDSYIWQEVYFGYATVMFLVLTIGFLGNVVSFIILRFPEHRRKLINPLMINLAIVDLLIIVLVYPPMVATNLLVKPMRENSLACICSCFANGAAGLTSIATLVAMSGVMYYAIKQSLPRPKIQSRHMNLIVAGTWLYGISLNLPPMIGWNRAIPGKAGFSCGPDWTSSDPWSYAYVVFLMVLGFFLPLLLICIFHILIYRHIGQASLPGNINAVIKASRQKSQMKLVRMTFLCIIAFLISWLPYTAVSVAAVVKGSHGLSSGEAEIPELMAKASVIYNPIVYTVMNGAYRASLWGMISGDRSFRVNTTNSNPSPIQNSSVNSGVYNQSFHETAL